MKKFMLGCFGVIAVVTFLIGLALLLKAVQHKQDKRQTQKKERKQRQKRVDRAQRNAHTQWKSLVRVRNTLKRGLSDAKARNTTCPRLKGEAVVVDAAFIEQLRSDRIARSKTPLGGWSFLRGYPFRALHKALQSHTPKSKPLEDYWLRHALQEAQEHFSQKRYIAVFVPQTRRLPTKVADRWQPGHFRGWIAIATAQTGQLSCWLPLRLDGSHTTKAGSQPTSQRTRAASKPTTNAAQTTSKTTSKAHPTDPKAATLRFVQRFQSESQRQVSKALGKLRLSFPLP